MEAAAGTSNGKTSNGASGLSRIAVQLGAQLGATGSDGRARDGGEPRVRLHAEDRLLTVAPVAADEVALAVRLAREIGAAISVGIAPAITTPAPQGRLHLDTSRLTALIHLDESSLLVHAQAGMRLDVLATRLSAAGMALGALPEASLGRTLGAMLADPRPSEANSRGRFVDLCAAVDAVLPDGTILSTRLAPRKATGPDFLHAIVGARGTTGIITGAWLRAGRRPPRRVFASFAFSEGNSALEAARTLLDRGARPADLALVDANPDLLDAPEIGSGVLLALHLDGVPELVAAEEQLATDLALERGGRVLPPPIAERFFLLPHAPELRQVGRGERFVPSPSLAEAWAKRARPTVLRGLRPAGAAILTDAQADGQADRPANSQAGAQAGAGTIAASQQTLLAARAALQRALDPAGLLSGISDGQGAARDR